MLTLYDLLSGIYGCILSLQQLIPRLFHGVHVLWFIHRAGRSSLVSWSGHPSRSGHGQVTAHVRAVSPFILVSIFFWGGHTRVALPQKSSGPRSSHERVHHQLAFLSRRVLWWLLPVVGVGYQVVRHLHC